MPKLINKETGFAIATTPEELPPLRDGYIRLIHQTHFNCAESLAENGLIYNEKFAQKEEANDYFKNYIDVTSMALAYNEDNFWERLTKEEIRHRGADTIAIFDMPIEECGAHQTIQITSMLNGTISRGYMVGFIPNYGTKDNETSERLSVSEMEEKKRISKSNPLPPYYETPNWRENVEKAWQAFYEQNQLLENNPFNLSPQNSESENDTDSETNEAEWDWLDFEDNNKEINTSSPKPEYIFNEKPDKCNYKNPDFQQKAEIRHKRKLKNQDYLQYKLKRIRKKLSYKKLEENRSKTENRHTDKTSEKHEKVAEIYPETAKTSPISFKQTTRNT